MTTPAQPTAQVADDDVQYSLAELREHGLLWLINRCVFHPRGYALALGTMSDGTLEGWTLLGDGSEPWRYDDTVDEDALHAAAEAFLAARRADP